MATAALVQDLREATIPLGDLYLDPNNPRFVGHDWIKKPDEQIADEAVQADTRQKMMQHFDVEKLRMNMEVNGYLPIDRVIVREFAKSKYVVLEGNRRICAAKTIGRYTMDGEELASEVLISLQNIPCLVYVGSDSNAAWIFQGLRHITGYADWSAFNKAKLLVEQMEEEGLSLTRVGQRFGLTAFGAGQWVRGYYAYKQAREKSDYTLEVDERSYPYFQELFSRSSAPMREWLEWDEDARCFKEPLNFNEYVGWLYPRISGEDTDAGSVGRGDWDRRVLKNRDDIRQLSTLLKDDNESFESFRSEPDVERAYAKSMAKKYEKQARDKFDPAEEVFAALKTCTKALNDIPHRVMRNQDYVNRLMGEIRNLEQAIAEVRP